MNVLKILVSFISRTFNLLVVLFLLLTIAAGYISPKHSLLVPIIGLLFPLAFILNLGCLATWLLRKRWFFLVSFLGLLISVPQLNNLISFKKESITPIVKGIKLMSYNVRNFDLYNWSNNQSSLEKILATLQDENPDIICFQEFYSDTTSKFNTIRKLKDLGFSYYYLEQELLLRKNDIWGIAIFSKLKIKNSGKLLQQQHESFYGSHPYKCIYIDVEHNKQLLRIYNTHLQSVHFGKSDYETIKEAKETQEIDEQKAKNIIDKLQKANSRRAIQAEELAWVLNKEKLPFILCGDFNDLPNSYTYNHIRQEFKDIFLDNSLGIGATYNGLLPFLRIDYMITSKNIQSSNFKIIKSNKISDHYPIVAQITL